MSEAVSMEQTNDGKVKVTVGNKVKVCTDFVARIFTLGTFKLDRW